MEIEATFKPNKVTALEWRDNLSEMKRFCEDDCIITYETSFIEDYFHLKVDDCLSGKMQSVALGSYVVRFAPHCFAVINSEIFKKYFEVEDGKVTEPDETKPFDCATYDEAVHKLNITAEELTKIGITSFSEEEERADDIAKKSIKTYPIVVPKECPFEGNSIPLCGDVCRYLGKSQFSGAPICMYVGNEMLCPFEIEK